MQAIYSSLIQQLHDHAKKKQITKAVIGVSGGLDSAVALCIAVRAFGPANVTAMILPEVGITKQEDIEHAKMLASHFGAKTFYQPINNFLVDFNFVTWDKTDTSSLNLKARIRSLLLRHCAEAQGAIVLSSANRSDFLLGFGCREGEFFGDIHILGDLYKTDVMEIAKHIGLPDELISKASTRGLRPHQSDEGDLVAGWSKIDDILRQLENNVDPETMIEKGMDSLVVHKVVRMLQESELQKDYGLVLQAGKTMNLIKKAQEAEASSLS